MLNVGNVLGSNADFFFLYMYTSCNSLPEAIRIQPDAETIIPCIFNKIKNNTGRIDLSTGHLVSDDALTVSANMMLELSFGYQKYFPINNTSFFHLLFMSDPFIHEMLLFFLFRGNLIIHNSVENEKDRNFIMNLFTDKVMFQKILLPFYNYIFLNKKFSKSLKDTIRYNDKQNLFKQVLMSRQFYRRQDYELNIAYLRRSFFSILQCDTLHFNINKVLDNDYSYESNYNSEFKLSMKEIYNMANSGFIDDIIEKLVLESDERIENILIKILEFQY